MGIKIGDGIKSQHGKWEVKDYSHDPDEYMYPHIIHQRPGYSAGVGRIFGNAMEIREGFAHSGSGFGAFGETKDWGILHFDITFPEDRIDARGKFAKELRDFVDGFLKREGLEVPDA